MTSKYNSTNRVQYTIDQGKTVVAEVEKQGDIYILHLGNKDNRLNNSTITCMIKALKEIELDYDYVRKEREDNGDDAQPGALVVTGNGHIFSNGLDIDKVFSGEVDRMDFFENYLHVIYLRILEMPMPTIAALNGHAFAGGMLLAMCFDYRVMRKDRGYLCMPEIELPGPLSPGMMSILISSIPSKIDLRDIMLQGKRYGAPEAHRKGIVDEICDADQVLPKAIELANTHAPLVIKSHKVYQYLRLEMRMETVKLLRSGGMGFVPRL